MAHQWYYGLIASQVRAFYVLGGQAKCALVCCQQLSTLLPYHHWGRRLPAGIARVSYHRPRVFASIRQEPRSKLIANQEPQIRTQQAQRKRYK